MLLFEDAVQKLNLDKKLKQLDQIKKIEYNSFPEKRYSGSKRYIIISRVTI